MSFIKSSKLWTGLALIASLACLGTIIYAVMGVRMGWQSMNFRSASTLIAQVLDIGFWVAIAAFATLVYALIRKQIMAQITGVIALLLIAIPLGINYANQPPANNGPRAAPLNDISTDTQNPPLFDAVAPLRPQGSNTLNYPANAPSLQAEQFPDIHPIVSELSKEAAFNRAVELVNSMGWDVVAEDSSTGIIEAVASTPLFSFEDDVVVRVVSQGAGSIIDIRSHSRIGRGDQGVNAARVRSFLAKF